MKPKINRKDVIFSNNAATNVGQRNRPEFLMGTEPPWEKFCLGS